MLDINTILLIFQMIMLVITLVLIFWLVRLTKVINLEKKFNEYTVRALNKKENSYFDKLYDFHVRNRSKLNKILIKSPSIRKYSRGYSKYIEDDTTTAMDFVSDKVFCFITFAVIGLFSDVIRGNQLFFTKVLLIGIIGFFVPDFILNSSKTLRKKELENDLLKAIIIMNNAFKSGRSTMQAIDIVSQELTGPLSEEFRKMYIDLTYGLSLEEVFKRFYQRVHIEEVKYMTTSLTILNKTGGNIVKVFSSIEQNFFNRRKIKQELKSLTASASVIYKILLVVPVVVFFVIFMVSPTYFKPLFNTVFGIIISCVILLLYISYIIVIKKVLTVGEDYE